MHNENLKFEVCYKLDMSVIDEFYKRKKKKKEPLGVTSIFQGDRKKIKKEFNKKLDEIMDQLEVLYYGDD